MDPRLLSFENARSKHATAPSGWWNPLCSTPKAAAEVHSSTHVKRRSTLGETLQCTTVTSALALASPSRRSFWHALSLKFTSIAWRGLEEWIRWSWSLRHVETLRVHLLDQEGEVECHWSGSCHRWARRTTLLRPEVRRACLKSGDAMKCPRPAMEILQRRPPRCSKVVQIGACRCSSCVEPFPSSCRCCILRLSCGAHLLSTSDPCRCCFLLPL
jgi:hypothetical protein